MDLGERVRSLRIKNNLTLDELASRCELTKGFLSQLENNVTSLSFNTLENIVEALGTSLEDFFKEEKQEKFIFTKSDYFIDDKDDSIIHWIVPNAQKNEMEPIILTLKAGATSKEMQPFEGEEFGYVLNGKITLINLSNLKKWTVKKGETFYFKGDFLHQLKNETSHEAQILWVTTPPIF